MAKEMMREPAIIDESSLTTVYVLGRGSFGSVTLERDSNFQLYAKKSSLLKNIKSLEKELRIMFRFRNHRRIVQAANPLPELGFNRDRCYIVMEFASKGTLDNMISQFRGIPMPENMIGLAARMILQGLEALHSYGYAHCDLKPANVLVFPSLTVGEPWELKLADFGLAKEPSTDPRSLFAGTELYMPPESFGPNGMIGPAVDIWSLGCVVLEMFGGCPEKIGNSYTWRLPKPISPMADDFLKQCLAFQPFRRATATELLKHPFTAQKGICVPPRPVMLPCPVIRNNVIPNCPRRPVMMFNPRP